MAANPFSQGVRLFAEAPSLEQARDAADHAVQDSIQLLGSRGRRGVKAQAIVVHGPPVRAIENQRVKKDVEILLRPPRADFSLLPKF